MIDERRYFAWHGGPTGSSPVVLAVPHAGRDYPAPLLAHARVATATLRGLEDRYADRLVSRAAAKGLPVLIATAPRALIDLNRDPRDRDDRGPTSIAESRAASGMGVFPRSISSVGELWRGPRDSRDLDVLIAEIHRPYHAALTAALNDARACHGSALLLDIHSMPRRAGRGWPRSADIVIGDRSGTSAGKALVRATEELIVAAGLSCARNTPYAGGYTTRHHGDPRHAVHAVQVEVARDLYLDPDGSPVDARVEPLASLIARIAARLGANMAGDASLEAAE
jgi:N-formylglutamate amidohydrolase